MTEQYRESCHSCRGAKYNCYCDELNPFDSKPEFVILMHSKETKKRIASGRMSHRSLSNSRLLVGEDFTENALVNSIINDSKFAPVILYPSRDAVLVNEWRISLDRSGDKKRPIVFVLDGTWNWANTIYRRSKNLHSLPKITFTKSGLSQFLVRGQPRPYCYATIEAIHEVITVFNGNQNMPLADQMLNIFLSMNQRYLKHMPKS